MHHKVQDFAKRKAKFDAFMPIRKAAGEIDAAISTQEGDPNNVYVLNTWGSVEELQAFLSNPELAAGMKEAGVMEAPTAVVFG